MIKILRTPAPAFLSSPKIADVKRKLEKNFYEFSKAKRQERLKFDVSLLKQIKPDLMRMFKDKCAYCESRLGVIAPGDIENFRPKAGARGLSSQEYAPMHYWWLAFEWENLLIACQLCNRHKKDYFPLEKENLRARIGAMGSELIGERALLIDPTLEDSSEHLKFDINGEVKELSKRGKVTIEILGLNRMSLIQRRLKEAGQLLNKLEIMGFTKDFTNSFTREFVAYIKELFSDSPSQEYAAVQRAIFDNWYETNSSLWEKAKQAQKDSSKTKRSIKKEVSAVSTGEIKAVSKQLSSLKRFSIKSIQIENFKSVEKLSLNMQPPKEGEERESWLLLLGDNGIGKSTILQAVALALSTKKQLAKLKLDVSTFLKRGTRKGKVVIQSYEHDQPITLYFDKNGFRTELVEAPTFVLAYGSTRLLPKGTMKPDKNKELYHNIRNLFDYSVSLKNPNEWLSNVNRSEFNKRIAPAFFDLLALRGNDKIQVRNGKISVRQFGENHELESNSDGYKTVTALVSDMMQTLSIEKADYHNSYGIVLIDEIGNHLHPRWRMKIAGALRKAFPKLQFIVTTHEPLCLRGLAQGEVVVMVRDQKDTIKALDRTLLPDHTLLRIDQLLTSDLFGLINVMDEETEKSYEQYYELLSKPSEKRTPEDEVQIQTYSSTLSEKEMLGSTPEVQGLFRVFSEIYAEKMHEKGFKTRENLKQETITEVKDILRKKDLDWL